MIYISIDTFEAQYAQICNLKAKKYTNFETLLKHLTQKYMFFLRKYHVKYWYLKN